MAEALRGIRFGATGFGFWALGCEILGYGQPAVNEVTSATMSARSAAESWVVKAVTNVVISARSSVPNG